MRIKKSFLCLAACALLVSCGSTKAPVMKLGQESFLQYQQETTQWVSEHRHFVSTDKASELSFNTPFEVKPAKPNGRGILFIHGLGDSPFTFTDLARDLAEHGYLVRVILLPGHGTKPADMIGSDSALWEKVVDEQMELLAKDVKEVWIGGFSTGGNLAINYAYKHSNVRGMVLFSPAIEVKTNLIKLAPAVDLFVTWLRAPDEKNARQTPFKYTTVPLDGIVAFKNTMDTAFQDVSQKQYSKPSIVALSQHDSILPTKKIASLFEKQLTSPYSRILWYGQNQPELKSDKFLIRTDYLPEERIESFAHMSMTFSPDNTWYGKDGKFRYCLNSMSAEANLKCQTEKDIWRGAWGATDGTKVFARLTFNPYYQWQLKQILEVLEAGAKTTDRFNIKETVEDVSKAN